MKLLKSTSTVKSNADKTKPALLPRPLRPDPIRPRKQSIETSWDELRQEYSGLG
ncbi:hypothetical protein SynA1524_01528 [Synechococcus sp. A15-24]|nr:hypothetical protein SynA1524_01528 [Synechococcus sp. A15-24]